MNVYKIRDHETLYAGGMGLVAANSKEEAIVTFMENTEYPEHKFNKSSDYTAILITNVYCDTKVPYLITEDWYYE